jgi:hypothetical protein
MRLREYGPVGGQNFNTYRIAAAKYGHSLLIQMHEEVGPGRPRVRVVAQPQSRHRPNAQDRYKHLKRDANSAVSDEEARQPLKLVIQARILLHRSFNLSGSDFSASSIKIKLAKTIDS